MVVLDHKIIGNVMEKPGRKHTINMVVRGRSKDCGLKVEE
jgi:hypothetical protein